MRKNKILFILHLPPPVHGSSVVGQYIKDSKVVNNAFDTRFINLSTSLTIDEIGKKPIRKITRYIKILSKVIVSLIFYNPKVVYLAITSKGPGFYKDLPIALLVKLFGKKLVLHYHSKGVSNYQHKIIDHWLYKILFKNSKVILLSENLFEDISKYVSKKDVYYCPNGIPVVEYSNNNLSLQDKSTPQLLFLSNLIESKGVNILLEALELLKDEGVVFHCNLVGGEGDISLNQLNFKIQSLELEKYVSYLGEKYDQEKYEIFNSSYCFIFPTYYHNETFGLVNLEAMMFELPVISTNEGGISDIVKHNETGFIVEKKNPVALFESIKQLIQNPELAKRMGKKGRVRFLELYTLEVFEKRLKYILNQI